MLVFVNLINSGGKYSLGIKEFNKVSNTFSNVICKMVPIGIVV